MNPLRRLCFCNHRHLLHIFIGTLLLIALPFTATASTTLVHHDLQVNLFPTQGRISVIDNLQLPSEAPSKIEFTLNRNLRVSAEGAKLQKLESLAHGPAVRYQLTGTSSDHKIRLRYEGEIPTLPPQGPFGMPAAILNVDGIYLDAASNWYPLFPAYPWLTFRLRIKAPEGWEIISQGQRDRSQDGFRYTMPHAQDDIFLVGGRFKLYRKQQNESEVEVYLLQPDAELAQRYLQASAEYLDYYSQLIGPYPYAKFAVIENQWQTGYGMPSFTMLGSRVIRLPFILHTSLPHEILHNWWGNGVFVDATSGNWSEGLTAYMADHWESEQRGQGSAYRRKALERYANFAAREHDFPLADFHSRHNESSQAVGYSKSLMVIHMIRQQIGDDLFNQRIRQFWQRYQFQPASYPDLINALLDGSKSDRETFMKQWLYRAGAPKLALAKVEVKDKATGFQLKVEIRQTQDSAPYQLRVPIEVHFKGTDSLLRQWVDLNGRHNVISLDVAEHPKSITLDPDYDVFRLLDPAETPSSLGRMFGARKQLLVLPTDVNKQQRQAWESLAMAWAKQYENVAIIDDVELDQLPADSAVWILGWKNKILMTYQTRFNSKDQQLMPTAVTIDDNQYKAKDYALVLLDPDNSRSSLGFIGARQANAIVTLTRKLPHYSSYGRLVFELPKVNNIIKQSLPVKMSPLTRQLDNK